MSRNPVLLVITTLLLNGCTGDVDKSVIPRGDSGHDSAADSGADSGDSDSGDSDSGETGDIHETGDTGDTGDTGGGGAEGFGDLSGDCGVLDAVELESASPWLFRNSIDFGDLTFDPSLLSEGAQEIYEEGTLGGSSGESEALAFDVLYRCEAAALIKSETEISYDDDGGKKTDILVEVDGEKIGVSVTRAYVYPPEDPYTVALATELLEKKLSGILESSANVSDEDAWRKQILSIVAYAPEHADAIETAWAEIGADLSADSIVYVTVTEGEDEFLY